MKNVLLTTYTSVHCAFCGDITMPSRELAEAVLPGRIINMNVHIPVMGTSPLCPPEHDLDAFNELFPIHSTPTFLFNFSEKILVGGVFAPRIPETIEELSAQPAEATLAADSETADDNISVTVRVTTDESTGRYRLGVVLVEDGVKTDIPQAGSELGKDYIHNKVYRKSATPITGEDLGQLTAGEEITKTYTFDAAGYDTRSCSIICYVVDSSDTIVRNAIECPANGSVGYK